MKIGVSILLEKRGLSCLLLGEDNAGGERGKSRVEAVRDWLEGCKSSDVNSSSDSTAKSVIRLIHQMLGFE